MRPGNHAIANGAISNPSGTIHPVSTEICCLEENFLHEEKFLKGRDYSRNPVQNHIGLDLLPPRRSEIHVPGV